MAPHREVARLAFQRALLDDDAEELYERAPCGYLSTTPDGLVIKANQTFLTLVGLSRDELIGLHLTDLLTAGGRIYHETHYLPMLHLHGAVRELAFDLVRADGALLPVLVNAGLERTPDGHPAVIRIALFDATERREYERELLRAKRRAEESEARAVALSRTLQKTLLPPSPPTIPHLELATAYRPAGDGREVGGDFYDVFQVSEDDWAVVLGDVSGKGVEAAVVTSLIRYSLRALAVRVADPAAALVELNDIVLADETDRFCTLVLARLARLGDGWTMRVSLAGHPPAVLRRAHGELEWLGEPGFLVGVVDDADYTVTEVVLGPGDTVLLYTDGVTEGRGAGELFGDDRLRAAVLGLGPGPDSLARGLLDEVLDFQGGLAHDDIAVVALRVP